MKASVPPRQECQGLGAIPGLSRLVHSPIVEGWGWGYLSFDMADNKASVPPTSSAGVDQLPINKTSNTVYIVAGAGVMVVLGLVLALSGGDEAKQEKAAQTEKAADDAQGMSKEELKEQQEHLKRTQAALIAAAAEEQEEAKEQKAAEAKKQQEAAEATAAASPQPASGSAAPKKSVNKKKTMDSLDGLGSDITSALK